MNIDGIFSNPNWIHYSILQKSTPLLLDTTLCDTFVFDFRQVSDFLRVFRFPPSIKLTATI